MQDERKVKKMTNTNVIAFPKRVDAARASKDDMKPPVDNAKVRKLAGSVLYGFMVVLAAFWPIVRWILSIDVFFRFLVMLWRWNTPGAHAGWTFAFHLGVLVTLTLLLATYKPKQ
jgi:hypothetical protein